MLMNELQREREKKEGEKERTNGIFNAITLQPQQVAGGALPLLAACLNEKFRIALTRQVN